MSENFLLRHLPSDLLPSGSKPFALLLIEGVVASIIEGVVASTTLDLIHEGVHMRITKRRRTMSAISSSSSSEGEWEDVERLPGISETL